MGYPFDAVPYLVVGGDVFDWHKAFVGQHSLSFGDTGQNCNLAFLAKFSVGAVLLDRYAEHVACGGAVEVLAVAERLQGCVLPCEPGEDARFDRAVVGDDEPPAVTGNESGSDELAEGVRQASVK